jgi:hypothetical protein
LVLVESREGALEVIDQGVSLPGFYNHIIGVGFDQIVLNFISKAVLDSALIRGPRVFKPKRHSHVAVGNKWCDERRLDLIILVEGDLVITRVAIEKG